MKKTENLFILYCVTSPSGKRYIGITSTTLEDRKSKHLYGSKTDLKNTKFSKAIIKYGIDNLKWEILISNLSQDEAILKEIEYIERFNTYKNGYNSTKGGDGAFGFRHTEETVKKIHEKLANLYYNDPEWIKLRSEAHYNWRKEHPEEAKQRDIQSSIRLKQNRDKWDEKRRNSLNCLEVKEKMVKSKGCKPFNVYNYKTKTYIGTWLLKTECSKSLSINSAKISMCLMGKRRHVSDYIFKYIDDPTVIGLEFNLEWLYDIRKRDI